MSKSVPPLLLLVFASLVVKSATPTPTPTPTPTDTPPPTPTPTPATDLLVTVSDGKSAATAGRKDTYTIVVTNSGPADVTGAVVSDSFPASFTGVTYTVTQSGGASGFTATGAGNINDIMSLPAGRFFI